MKSIPMGHTEGENVSWLEFCEKQRYNLIRAGFRVSSHKNDDWVPLIYNGETWYIHPDDVLPFSWFKRGQTLDRREFKMIYNNKI